MSAFRNFGWLAALFFALAPAAHADPIDPSAGVDFAALQKQLTTDGLTGWMHAVVPSQGLYVFTWRDPNDFFTSAEFPVVSHVPGVMDKINGFHRNDKILVKGDFLQNGAPQRHIYASEVTLVTPYDGVPPEPYQYTVKLPDDLNNAKDLIARVHYVDPQGQILVIDYKDVVLPVYVDIPAVATTIKGFYRGDKIHLHYVMRSYPSQPSHLSPDPAVATPIEQVQSALATNGTAASLTGNLVLFPKSPEINLDVYAMQVKDADGTLMTYTLFNQDDPKVFQAILDKMAAVYNANSMHAVNGRNKFLLPNVTVHAVGTLNVQSPTQANPQIMLKSADDVTATAN